MAAIVTTSMRIYAATLFMDGFSNSEQYVYLFIGNTLPWTNENSPPTPIDSVGQSISAFDTMMSLKRINANGVSLVVPRNIWTVSTVYTQYSQYVDLFDPTSGNPPFFVISDQLNVYKCLNNNGGVASVVQPTGTATTPITVADGYQWKYMYTVTSADVLTFVTNEWIPVTTLITNDGSNQWLVQQAAVPGTIDRIDMVTVGSQYTAVPTVTITGDGVGAAAVATISAGNVTKITVTAAGSGYTNATISITGGGIGANGATATAIISPIAGHGADPISELGGFFVLVDCKLDSTENGYFTVLNDYRVIGILQNPILNDGLGTTPATAADYTQAVSLTFSSVSGTTFNNDEVVTGGTSGATGVVMDWDGSSVLRVVQTQGTFRPGETVSGADASGVLQTITGTAQGGTTAYITLASSASSVNNTYIGQTVLISGGTGSGQVRVISSYTGLTRQASVSTAWTVAPDNTSTYIVASIIASGIVPYKGNILYIENRRPIARAVDQIEDIKIVIEF